MATRQKAPLKRKRSQPLKPEHAWKIGDQFRLQKSSDVYTIVIAKVLLEDSLESGFVFCDGQLNYAVGKDYFVRNKVTRIGNING